VDGLEDGESILAIGIDAGTDSGEKVATPLETDAVGGLAKNDVGMERPMEGVVGIGTYPGSRLNAD
jgi:hypothetical protein